MTESETAIADLRNKVSALEHDRDYWRDQHDLVMQDWRADIEAWTAARAGLAADHNACRAALADLLRFFDPTTGAVATRLNRDFIGDAFAKAQRIYATARAATGSEEL